jgi:hypothetical protein
LYGKAIGNDPNKWLSRLFGINCMAEYELSASSLEEIAIGSKNSADSKMK